MVEYTVLWVGIQQEQVALAVAAAPANLGSELQKLVFEAEATFDFPATHVELPS